MTAWEPEPEGRSQSSRPLLRFQCVGCGYGASCRRAPERCPMCGGTAWSDGGRQPFSDLSRDLAAAARRAADELAVFPGVPLS